MAELLSTYGEFAPDPRLADVVECFWTGSGHSGAQPVQHRILPDGCMDIIFDLRPSSDATAFVVGTMSRPHLFTTQGWTRSLGVRFRPGGLRAFVRLDATELVDEEADLQHFWCARATELREKLGELPTRPAVELLQITLLKSRVYPVDPYIAFCVSQLTRPGERVRLRDLERGAGLSERQLERRFASSIGVSPKLFARIARFRTAVRRAENHVGRIDWAALAAECGYADQSHLAREFREFSGLSPTAFLARGDGFTDDVGILQDAGL